jgi:hypothetical protein
MMPIGFRQMPEKGNDAKRTALAGQARSAQQFRI